MSSTGTGIVDFNTIADSVSLYVPKINSEHTGKSPKLIVLATWMAALPKNIIKYTAAYQKLFPNAAILLVQSSVGDVFSSEANQATRLKAASDAVVSYKLDKTVDAPILLHAMSNGGALVATRMATIINVYGLGKVFDQVIYDCLPGRPNVESYVKAVCIGLSKSPIVQFLARWGIRTYMHLGNFVFVTLLRHEDVVTRLRRQLNDSQLFDQTAPRLYLYSKADKLIESEGVHEHALQANTNGWMQVKEVAFEKAPHCALMLEDFQLYWSSIQNLV